MKKPSVRIAKLSEFHPQKRNANKHTQRGLGMLGNAMSKVGYVAAMTAAADGEVIDGSARLETVADKFGDEVLVIEHDGTRPIITVRSDIPNANTKRAKRISLEANRIGEVDLDWDVDVLTALPEDALAGLWDERELQAMGVGDPDGDADAEPEFSRADELLEKWQVKRGDIFAIGSHKLLCGDSTVRADVERVMDGEKCGTLTDPPYGVDFAYDAASQDAASENDRITDAVIPILPHPLVYTPGKRHLLRELSRWEEKQVKLVAWHKKFSMTRSGLGGADVWEIVLVVGADGKLSHMATNHIECMTDREPGLLDKHPCPKPVGLFQQLAASLLGQFILDPFAGSGTTLVAAQNLNRRARGIEISPAYCAVILQRMADAFPGIDIHRIDE